MKDIKENQKGLKSLASERPDVVRKMGYDPESFYAGGLAMLAEGVRLILQHCQSSWQYGW